jgi:subtilase family serine protease
VVEDCLAPPALCYAPKQFRAAYGVQSLVSAGTDGQGETVVLPELANKPPASPPGVTDIRQDLQCFDDLFGLPAPHLRIVTSLAGSSAPYLADGEEVEDIEMLHAVAPAANIVVVLVPSDATGTATNFTNAVVEVLRTAVPMGAAVVSISASYGEHVFTPAQVASLHSALQSARDDDVTVVAASGDSGAVSDEGLPKQVSLPASDPLVLAVGGTSLDANPATGAYYGELAWDHVNSQGDDDASGGGFSYLFSRPSYQDGVAGIGTNRGVPDVSADADTATGMAVAIGDGGQRYIVIPARGTSAATPFWAGIVALADQFAGRHPGFVNAGIYRIGRSTYYHKAFHDVTAGDNTVMLPSTVVTGYEAGPGWDPVTGWGSPDAQVLVPLLGHYVHAGDGAGL